jgi:uncharacterized protein involved in type VI secretion and phage assembly
MASRKRLILAQILVHEAICAASHYQMSYRLNRRDLDLPRVVLLKSRLTVAISRPKRARRSYKTKVQRAELAHFADQLV